MIITYKFADDTVSAVEVEDELGLFILESRKDEENLSRKERYHGFSIEGCLYEGIELSTDESPEKILQREVDKKRLEKRFDEAVNSLSETQRRRLAHNIDELIKLATVPETAATAMADIEKFSEEMKTLREFIETEKARQMTAQRGSAELDAVLERLENEDFTLTEYNDVVVRQLIEKITVENKETITVTFKGGFEVRKELNGN